MRICLVGHLTGQPDEGVRNILTHLAHALRVRHEAKLLPMRHTTWGRVRAFRPDVIHFVLTPTSMGLLAAKALATAHRHARIVISAPHPSGDVFNRWLMPFRPNLILAQALDSERRFRTCGYRTAFLPNGVDTDTFSPVNEETKQHLRQQYGIGRQFIVLHVGPLKAGRNIQLLGQLQSGNRQVLIVGRPSDPAEKEVVKELQEKGCILWSDYFENIQEIYTLSDCYVFPTVEHRYCVETPLSVLEAMACNLPVVSTPFGALPRIAGEGEGLVYAQTADEFERAIASCESGDVTINTRHKVLQLSWTNLVHRLEDIYAQLLR